MSSRLNGTLVFLVLYEAVLEGNETNDDSKFSESEQIRAIRCVKKWLEKQ